MLLQLLARRSSGASRAPRRRCDAAAVLAKRRSGGAAARCVPGLSTHVLSCCDAPSERPLPRVTRRAQPRPPCSRPRLVLGRDLVPAPGRTIHSRLFPFPPAPYTVPARLTARRGVLDRPAATPAVEVRVPGPVLVDELAPCLVDSQAYEPALFPGQPHAASMSVSNL